MKKAFLIIGALAIILVLIGLIAGTLSKQNIEANNRFCGNGKVIEKTNGKYFDKYYKWERIHDKSNCGIVWTSKNKCETNNLKKQEIYSLGDQVYINGINFMPGEYNWKVKGEPGKASCNPNKIIANGSYTVGENGEFCFEAHLISSEECGVYKVEFGKKSHNYKVYKKIKGAQKNNSEPVEEIPENEIPDYCGLGIPGSGNIYGKILFKNNSIWENVSNTRIKVLCTHNEKINLLEVNGDENGSFFFHYEPEECGVGDKFEISSAINNFYGINFGEMKEEGTCINVILEDVSPK